MNDVLYSDKSVIVSAPTGSVAPLKALCSERYLDWSKKFSPHKLNCVGMTSDTSVEDYYRLKKASIILTTPEKLDMLTRTQNRAIIERASLILIDEIHILNDNTRGATLEAVISRIKAYHISANDRGFAAEEKLRFLAISATIPNAQDVAEWLELPNCNSSYFRYVRFIGVNLCYLNIKAIILPLNRIDDSYRPVQLEKVVLAYEPESRTTYQYNVLLSYQIAGVLLNYADSKPTLIFCNSRITTENAARTLMKDAKFTTDQESLKRLYKESQNIKNKKLQDCLRRGVGYHHAGLDSQERKILESLFSSSVLPVLCMFI
ncbi:putative ATP-dependent DNA helicase HFM1 [Trichoplax sp. H2]|nr:putative ATP-dependent DNA helicase HFM1 [Trichoplax sp. H2]|eukprot:RDD43016.1 putative ATP-dependent DNA helicase HFM1 [Trichoplax sp. H2]